MTLSILTTFALVISMTTRVYIGLFVVEFEARSVLCYMGIVQGRTENWVKIPPPK